MADLFLKLLNLSLSASYLVVMVAALRLVFKKAPKWVYPVLWGVVALRLICPISVESVLSLLPSAEPIPADIAMAARPGINSGIPAVNQVVNPVIAETFAPNPVASVNPLQIWLEVGGWLWLAGAVAMGVYTAVTYLGLRRRVSTAAPLGENVYRCDRVDSPFVLGLFRPRIYLPVDLEEEKLPHIVAHEQAHIRRKDHLWKPLGFALLALHWFNPLLWLAYCLLCRDIELACDEKVIKELGREGRADYSEALLTCSVNRRTIAACPLAFGEVGVKQRVKSVLSYKRPGFWVVSGAVVLCAVFAVCFLTNPRKMVVRRGVYEPGELIYSVSETSIVEEWFPAPSPLRKTEALGPYLCRLTADGSLEFKSQPAGENLWRPGFRMEPCDFSDENFAELTENAKGWDSNPIGPIDDAMLAQENNQSIYLFRTKDGTDYLGISVKPYAGANEFLAYLTKLDLIEEYPEKKIPEPTGTIRDWGLNMDITDASPTGLGLYFWQDGAPITGSIWYSDAYALQKQDGKKWVDLPKFEEPEWTGEDIPADKEPAQFLDWEAAYGALPSGTYRVGKTVYLHSEEIGETEKTVWAAFTVKGTDSGAKQLTAADLLTIKDRGEALTWDTFRDYACVESGAASSSDQPIRFHREYRLGDHLGLTINGRGPDYQPNSMALYCRDCVDAQPTLLFNFDQNENALRRFLTIHDRPLPEGETDHLGIHFEVQNAAPTGAEVVLERRDGKALLANPLAWYSLSKLEDNGSWTWVTEADVESVTEIKTGRTSLNWEDRYGALPGGRYCLSSRMDVHDGSDGGVFLTAEFTIPEPASGNTSYGVTLSVSEITPEHLLVKFLRPESGVPLYLAPGFTLEKTTDQGWAKLNVGTWDASYGEFIDFDWYAREGSGMFLSWDRSGALNDGRYRLGLTIATEEDLSKAQTFPLYAEFTLDTTDWVDGRMPLSQIPINYHPEDAELDGCLVMTAGVPRSSAGQIFAPFREAVDTGVAASVRFVTSYFSETDLAYDMFVHDLRFDGRGFTLRWLENGQEQLRTYRYLKRFTQPKPENAVGSYISEWFVLTNEAELTMDTYNPEIRASQQGVDPEHEILFCEQTFVKSHPELPGSLVRADLNLNDQTLVSLTDPEALGKLLALFANAEILGYEPKTHSTNCGLELVLLPTPDQGEPRSIYLDCNEDICRMGNDYIFYGGYDEPDYIQKLWACFGIEAWPDAVYEAYPDSFRG